MVPPPARPCAILGCVVPIILLASQDLDAETIQGLDAGANDFVAKPLRFGVLLARIRANCAPLDRNAPASRPLGPLSVSYG